MREVTRGLLQCLTGGRRGQNLTSPARAPPAHLRGLRTQRARQTHRRKCHQGVQGHPACSLGCCLRPRGWVALLLSTPECVLGNQTAGVPRQGREDRCPTPTYLEDGRGSCKHRIGVHRRWNIIPPNSVNPPPSQASANGEMKRL